MWLMVVTDLFFLVSMKTSYHDRVRSVKMQISVLIYRNTLLSAARRELLGLGATASVLGTIRKLIKSQFLSTTVM